MSRIVTAELHLTSATFDVSKTATPQGGQDVSLPVGVAIIFDSVAPGSRIDLNVDVTGTRDGMPIGRGSTSARVSGGQHTAASVRLVGGTFDLGPMPDGLDDAGADLAPSLVVSPPVASVTQGKTIAFTANMPVTWKVMEAGGGTIDAQGKYTAPSTPATYHVVAKGVASSVTVTIRVAAYGVDVLAGMPGGPGNVDGTGPAARFVFAEGIVSEPNGATLYVADAANQTIRKIAIATGVVTTIAGQVGVSGNADGVGAAAQFSAPTGLALSSGTLYVADSQNNSIRAVVLSTKAVTTLAGGTQGYADGTGAAAQFVYPGGVTLDGAGNLYVADSGNNVIRKIVIATGAVTTIAGTANMTGTNDGVGAATRFNSPNDVIAVGANTLYIADTQNYTIRKMDLISGMVTTLAGAAGVPGAVDAVGTNARFDSPWSVSLDGQGRLIVGDLSNNTVRQVDPATGAVTTIAGAAGQAGFADGVGPAARFDGPRRAAYSLYFNSLYVTDEGNDTIGRSIATAQ